MNRKLFTTLTATMWMAIPLTALRYWVAWDKLPARMATHFAANGQPNGWMGREVSLYFAMGVTAFVLVAFSAIACAIQEQKGLNASSAGLLGFFYLMLGLLYYANNSVVAHNLTGGAVETGPVLIGVPIAVLLFTLIYLGTQRGDAFPRDHVFAEEVHGSRVWSLVFATFTGLEFAIFAAIPSTGVRLGLFLMCFLFLLIAAHAWTGFQYRFTPSGVEIRTLGFRLRSILQGDIRDYRIENWGPWRGYGIRGIGNTRAYVWGNKVVHISTSNGEVFLGHNDPARIMHDLDQMKQFTHS
jgi:hypothetical protein